MWGVEERQGAPQAAVGLRVETSLDPPPFHPASRVREQLQSIQGRWTGVQERSEQRKRQLLASLQLQVRGPAQVHEASPRGVPRSLSLH